MMPFACVEYDFYANVFLGAKLGPEDFPRLAARGMRFVDGMCRGKCRAVPEQDWPQIQFAVCAVAEILADEERLENRCGITSETVGNYSVKYGALSRDEREYPDRKKRDALALYLSDVPALRGLFEVRSFACMHHIP